MDQTRVLFLPGLDGTAADTNSATIRRPHLQRVGRQHRRGLAGRALCDCGRVICWSDRDRAHDTTPGHGANSLRYRRNRSGLQGTAMARDAAAVQATDAGIPIASVLGRQVRRGSAVRDVAATVASVPREILSSRFRLVLEMDETETFARCVVPTLYLRSSGDRIVPESARRRMASLRPMTTARVPGPHLLLEANPDDAWPVIMAFLDEGGVK